MQENIKKEIKELNKKFNKIKNMNYVKSIKKGYGGIGDTFEYLLGKEKSDFSIPDYKNFEIKTKRTYSKSSMSLFCAVPDGKDLFEIERLRKTYGYPDKEIRTAQVLYAVVYGNKLSPMGAKYFFKLQVDKKEEKVFLCIYNRNMELLEKKVYWTFKLLEERLYCKLKYLMLVNAWDKKIENDVYYKYYKAEYYGLKDFNTFIDLIDKGYISVTLRVSVYRGEYRHGLPANHGTSFGIKLEHLPKLYNKISGND